MGRVPEGCPLPQYKFGYFEGFIMCFRPFTLLGSFDEFVMGGGVWPLWPHPSYHRIYILPNNSMYYEPNAFASIQSHCATNCHKQHILVGDFNARLGTAVNELAEITENISYESIDHSPRNDNPSPHGRRLRQICHDNKLLVINNLRYEAKQWKGSLTYRMRDSWKSERDLCTVS